MEKFIGNKGLISVSDPDLNVTIKQAMQTISGNTCIWFDRKKRFDNDYINITSRFNG